MSPASKLAPRTYSLVALFLVPLVLTGCSGEPRPAPMLRETDVIGEWAGGVDGHEITLEFSEDKTVSVDNLPLQAWFDDDEPLDWSSAISTVGTWDLLPDSSDNQANKIFVELERTPGEHSTSLIRSIYVRRVDGKMQLLIVFGRIDELSKIVLDRR